MNQSFTSNWPPKLSKQIYNLDPSLNELEITAAYLAGMDDIMGKKRLPLIAKTAKIFEIVTRDEAFVEEEYPRG